MRKFTKMLLMLLVIAAAFGMAPQARSQTTLLTESFENAGSIPPNWATIIVAGSTNGISYITSGTTGYPAITVFPYNGSYEVFYNSYSIVSGSTRLYRTAGTSTVGYAVAIVDFAMFHDLGYAGTSGEGILPQYSIDGGVTWNPAGSIILRNDGSSGWKIHTVALPANAAGQANLRIGFLFSSQFGNNCFMDFVHLYGANTGTLAGTVTNFFTGTPLAGVSVVVNALPAVTTNGAGFYSVANVNAGTATINATLAQFQPYSGTATVTAGITTTKNFTMNPIPSYLAGLITDCATNAPIPGAKVTVGTVSTYTLGNGTYNFQVYPIGAQTVTVSKPGYITGTGNTTVVFNTTTTFNMCLLSNANPPGPVTATLNISATAVNVAWSVPAGLYELVYDDGTRDDWSVWALAGNMNAMKFTPINGAVQVMSGSINIGDAVNYAAGTLPSALAPFEMAVYDATGAGGTPGAPIGNPITVTPTTFGWNAFTFPTPIGVTGTFYLVMTQGGTPPNAAGLAVDLTTNTLRSYSRFVTGGGPWLPASGNFMIRAVVTGAGNPNGGIPYTVWRLLEGQELTPALWSAPIVSNTTATTVTDNNWPSLPDGPYRWAVEAGYPVNRMSPPTFSNPIGKNWTAGVTVNVTLTCDSTPVAGTVVTLQNANFAQYVYTATLTNTGTVTFPAVWKGTYTLTISKLGYDLFTQGNNLIMGPMTFNVELLQSKVPPSNPAIDNTTLLFTWSPPSGYMQMINEAFTNFTDNAWVAETNWLVAGFGNPTPSAEFIWVPVYTNYSYSLTSKSFTGQGSPNFTLKYDIYLSDYASDGNEKLDVEIQVGGAGAWTSLKSYANNGSINWTTETFNLAAYTNSTFKIRFRAHGANSFNINNWNIDNFQIISVAPDPRPCILAYNVYLNGTTLVGVTTDTTYFIPPAFVNYGSVYTACVKAVYGSGYSAMVCTPPFTSHFLCPPSGLTGIAIENNAQLTWVKPFCNTGTLITYTYDDGVPENGLAINPGFNIQMGNWFNLDPTVTGLIKSLDMSFTSTAASSAQNCIVYFYNSTYQLIGQSDPFLNTGLPYPQVGWITVTINDIPFTGAFYALVDYTITALPYKNYFYFDESPPQLAPYGHGWTNYAGTFGPASTTFGYPPLTWLQRATCFVFGKKGPEEVQFDPSQGPMPKDQPAKQIANAAVNLGPDRSLEGGIAPPDAPQVVMPLLGYHIYRDDVPVATVANPNTLEYLDQNLDPGLYHYKVDAYYNVSPFVPSPANSAKVGPVDVLINYGRPLPFFEPWNAGTFGFNNWSHNSPNWTVNTGFGNPPPTADFSWLPNVTNYDTLSITTPVLSAGIYTCASIWCDFDIKLIDHNATGNEKLDVEILLGGHWKSEITFSNNGSFDWAHQHIDISPAMGKAFKVRFRAHGANSADILHWYVDNINIYAVCTPPSNLTAHIQANNVNLSWSPPYCVTQKQGPPPTWLTWDDGTNFDGIGLTAGGTFDYAARWDVTMLTALDGGSVTHVKYYPRDVGTFILRVWQGDQAANLVYEQPVTPTLNAWNDVTLTTPATLDITQELWVGFNLTHNAGYFPAGTDGGPNVVDYGFWANLGTGWQDLSIYFDYNWDIEVLVATAKTPQNPQKTVVLTQAPIHNTDVSLSASGIKNTHSVKSIHHVDAPDTSSLQGYNVYRSDDNKVTYNKINQQIVTDTTYVDMNVSYATHYYYVTSVFAECASDSSNVYRADVIEGITPLNGGTIAIYPNPATDNVFVKSDFTITNIELLNYIGQTVYTKQNVSAKTSKVNVSALNAGVYFMKVTTVGGIKTAKITVTK